MGNYDGLIRGEKNIAIEIVEGVYINAVVQYGYMYSGPRVQPPPPQPILRIVVGNDHSKMEAFTTVDMVIDSVPRGVIV